MPINRYCYNYNNNHNNNNFNRRGNHHRGSYSNHQTFRSTTVINNLTILPLITEEANVLDKPKPATNSTACNNVESVTEVTENIIEKSTTIVSEIGSKDVDNDEVGMEINSNVDTVKLPDTSPNRSEPKSILHKAKNKNNERRKSTAGRKVNPILPVERKKRSASTPSDYLSLLNPSVPSSIITRSKSRENLILKEKMHSFKKKKILTNEKNSETNAEQSKAEKSASKTIKHGSMSATKTNAETNSQMSNRDPRLQNRKNLKYKISLSSDGEASMSTIAPNTSSLKIPTHQRDAEQESFKIRMIEMFGDDDSNSPPKEKHQTDTGYYKFL